MKRISLSILVFALFIITGCASINDFDLTGRIPLYEYTDGNGYRKYLSSNNIQDLRLRPGNFLFSILSLEGFYRMVEINREERSIPVTICNESYIVLWDNRTEVEITGQNGRRLELLEVRETSDGDWGGFFDVYDTKWTDKTQYIEKSRLYKFIEPNTKKEFSLYAFYRFAVRYIRTIEAQNGRKVVTDYSIKPSFRSSLEISYRDYLHGHTVVKGKKDKEYRLDISVYDENLDGRFNNQDVMKVHDYTDIFHLGQEINFDRKGQSGYFFDLQPPHEDGKEERAEYILEVKKITD